ncbi:hypothetical protein HGRIS_007311 [Hohenbuehelia grisea]|uniref:Uncharacterized protein n=1 Tax=Hohenbuehelia grisea TaxID=104357 RepID=A0ABR3J4K0_9AGAR
MSAAARAEARRKAILSRGNDRLAKLTSSARGDDAPNIYPNPPLPNISQNMRNFVGEDTDMPPPPNRASVSPSPRPSSQQPAAPDPSEWSQEQQMQMLQAMMGQNFQQTGSGAPPFPGMPPFPPLGGQDAAPGADPFSAMLASVSEQQKQRGKASTTVQKPPTRLQKLMPLIHLGAIWCLLAYFVLYKEPQMYGEEMRTQQFSSGKGIWGRWAELGRTTHIVNVWRIAIVVSHNLGGVLRYPSSRAFNSHFSGPSRLSKLYYIQCAFSLASMPFNRRHCLPWLFHTSHPHYHL